MPRQSLKQVAFDTIKEKILSFEYEPNQFLNEDVLCNDLNMSRTPVRDALSRLEQEGLVTIVPKKGFFIAPLTISDINQVFEGRALIEPYVVATYCSHLTDDVLNTLADILRRHKEVLNSKGKDIYALDCEFHNVLLAQCQNVYLQGVYQRLEAQNTRLRVLSGNASMERLELTYEEHLKIYTELCRRNADTAAELMKQHIMNAKDSAFATMLNSNSLL